MTQEFHATGGMERSRTVFETGEIEEKFIYFCFAFLFFPSDIDTRFNY